LKWCEQTEVVFLEGGERAFNGPHFGVNAHHPHRLEVQIIGQWYCMKRFSIHKALLCH